MATKCLLGRQYIQCGYTGQRSDSHLGQKRVGFHHTTQHSVQFNTHEYIYPIYVNIHLILSDHN
jgi:hypothetical protein